MKVTEQIDALRALGVNYVKRLIVPRIMAAVIVFPLVTVLADCRGARRRHDRGGVRPRGGSVSYWNTIAYWVVIRDFLTGLVKSLVFGLIVTSDRLLQRPRYRGRDGRARALHHRHRGAGGDGGDHLRLLPHQAPPHPLLVMATREGRPWSRCGRCGKRSTSSRCCAALEPDPRQGNDPGGDGRQRLGQDRAAPHLRRPPRAGRRRGVHSSARASTPCARSRSCPCAAAPGYVFQNAALFDSLSVFENVAFPLREHARLSEGKSPIVSTASSPWWGSRHRRPPPGRAVRRHAQARGHRAALIMEPEVVFFDEPTAGLDPTNSRLVAELIAELAPGRGRHRHRGHPRRRVRRHGGRPDGHPLSRARFVEMGTPRRDPPLRQPRRPRLPRGRAARGLSDARSPLARASRCGSGSSSSSRLALSGRDLPPGRPVAYLRAQVRPLRGLHRGGRADRRRHRAAGRRADRASHQRWCSPEVGGKVRVTLTVARRFSERIRGGLGGSDRDPGPSRRQAGGDQPGKPEAPALKPGELIATQEFFEMGRSSRRGRGRSPTINRLAVTLQRTPRESRRERGGGGPPGHRRVRPPGRRAGGEGQRGWLHALLYEEPEALRQLNGLLADARETLARTRERRQCGRGAALPGERAVGARAARRGGLAHARDRQAKGPRARTSRGSCRRSSSIPSTNRWPRTSAWWPATSARSRTGWSRARASSAGCSARRATGRWARRPPTSGRPWPISA